MALTDEDPRARRMTTSSPLVDVERAVQERAKAAAIDMRGPDGPARLHELIQMEVDHWNDEFKRGRRDYELADPDLVAERAWRNLTGYGPLEPLLTDEDVWEIEINAPDLVFVRRHRGVSGYHEEVFHDDDHVLRTLTKILDDSTQSHRKLDPTEGLQDAQLDTGARIHIVHSDIGRDGHILVNIRRFTGAAMWFAFNGTMHTAQSKVDTNVNSIGSGAGSGAGTGGAGGSGLP
jgi:pilus assembly protein CpaF